MQHNVGACHARSGGTSQINDVVVGSVGQTVLDCVNGDASSGFVQVHGSLSSNVGGGHGSSRDGSEGVSSSSNPSSIDILSRGKDVQASSKAGKASTDISVGSTSRGTNSGSQRFTGGGTSASIVVAVSSSDGHKNSLTDGSGNCVVEGLGQASSKGHVGN